MRAIDKIVAEKPGRVLLALDNDGPGREAAAEIAAACEAAGIAVETAWPAAGEKAKDPCAALAQVSFTTTKCVKTGPSQ
jgi:DNA primase